MTDPNRLSQIETLWSMVYTAHGEGEVNRSDAQHQLLARYGGAIQRYLVGALRDANAAEDIYQEFAVKFLRGDFRSANEAKGRFRSFLKVVLGRMVADYYRRHARRPTHQLDSSVQVTDESEAEQREREFLNVWRDEMLTSAWNELAQEEARTGKPWMRVLKLRVENPDLRSAGLAEALAKEIDQPVTATRVRVLLHRARERFSNFLINAVSETLSTANIESVEQELAELQLLQYCQAIVEQRKNPPQ